MGEGVYTAVAIDAVHETKTRELHMFVQLFTVIQNGLWALSTPTAILSWWISTLLSCTHALLAVKKKQNPQHTQKGAPTI